MFKPVNPMPQIEVPDAIQWLNTCVVRALGKDHGIDRFPVAIDCGDPKVLAAENIEGQRFLLSTHSPENIRHIRTPFHWLWPFSWISQPRSKTHPLIPLSRHIQFFRLSSVNCGSDFDYKASQVWKRLTGEDLFVKELWLYIPPRANG